jgi:hypothetical protein
VTEQEMRDLARRTLEHVKAPGVVPASALHWLEVELDRLVAEGNDRLLRATASSYRVPGVW